MIEYGYCDESNPYQVASCGAATGNKCVFPFRVGGRMFHSCTKFYSDVGQLDGAERRPWCSLETDDEHNHVGAYGYCDSTCNEAATCLLKARSGNQALWKTSTIVAVQLGSSAWGMMVNNECLVDLTRNDKDTCRVLTNDGVLTDPCVLGCTNGQCTTGCNYSYCPHGTIKRWSCVDVLTCSCFCSDFTAYTNETWCAEHEYVVSIRLPDKDYSSNEREAACRDECRGKYAYVCLAYVIEAKMCLLWVMKLSDFSEQLPPHATKEFSVLRLNEGATVQETPQRCARKIFDVVGLVSCDREDGCEARCWSFIDIAWHAGMDISICRQACLDVHNCLYYSYFDNRDLHQSPNCFLYEDGNESYICKAVNRGMA